MCVWNCVYVFVVVRNTDPAHPLLCPAICHCCTLGSVRMVWFPDCATCRPHKSPEVHCRPSYPPPRPSLNYIAITQPGLGLIPSSGFVSFTLHCWCLPPHKNYVAISKYNIITGLALNYLSFKYKSKAQIYVGVGNLLITSTANDVITRRQQIGYPLKGDMWTHL